MIDYEALDALRKAYQGKSENVGQAWAENWGLDAALEAEAKANAVGAEWLRAVHSAWPELRAELAALRQQLDEAQEQLAVTRIALTAAQGAHDLAEADRDRLLDVYRAAEAVVAQDIFVFPSAEDQPAGTDRAEQAALDALAAKVDAYRAGTPAESPDGERA